MNKYNMKKMSVVVALWMVAAATLFAQKQSATLSFTPQEEGVAGLQPQAPKHEVRAVWLTTIGGIDWPHSYAMTPQAVEKQKRELCDILDRLQKVNINTILIQARIRGTVIYDTNEEPWDGCLSGHPGTGPGYDALAFAIQECHRRGMECHAWVVTIPCGKWNAMGCKSLRDKFPGMVLKAGEDGFLDPSNPKTGDYLAKICGDITRRYDVDGIHLDYIRFPDGIKKLPEANAGRRQITDIVRKIHHAVKSQKPWVKLSCSPIGKHDDLRRYSSHGWNARKAVLQDAQAWLRDGLMDMEFPMMYFRGDHFYPFAIDWKENSYGREVCPGLGIYFMHPNEKNWPLIDITRELCVLRQYGIGQAYFRSKFLTDNTKGLYDYLANEFYRYPSLIKPLHANGFSNPGAPTSVERTLIDGKVFVTWGRGTDHSDGDYLTYNIYASDVYPVDVTRAENIVAIRMSGEIMQMSSANGLYYAVTAVDRYGNESLATQEQTGVKVPAGVKPGWYWVTHPLGDVRQK